MNIYYPFYLVLHLLFLIIHNLILFYQILKENLIEFFYFNTDTQQKTKIINSIVHFEKKPKHLGIVLGNKKERAKVKNISQLIIWSSLCDVAIITILDSKDEGEIDLAELSKYILEKSNFFLKDSKIKRIKIMNSESILRIDLIKKEIKIEKRIFIENKQFNFTETKQKEFKTDKNKIRINIITQKESRVDFVEMIKNCGETMKESQNNFFSFNESVIRSNLKGVNPKYPDPQLILTFSTNLTTSGFLPFHIYASEIL
eukprot:TRINITY_DN7156_c0_g1_i1.p1 TRINITY_DN7156_c0_g1~~TRINITY_DN7156_c0_g1_i1.p1  ORF type:complete len:278 (+),score=36.54 TRINITY_DN7156_c0_g1_i1:61-834(+)